MDEIRGGGYGMQKEKYCGKKERKEGKKKKMKRKFKLKEAR